MRVFLLFPPRKTFHVYLANGEVFFLFFPAKNVRVTEKESLGGTKRGGEGWKRRGWCVRRYGAGRSACFAKVAHTLISSADSRREK